MEKNIFENAKLGDRFISRSGKKFVFQRISTDGYAQLFSENSIWSFPLDGKSGEVDNEFDIIGKHHDPIDEEKLDELASTYIYEIWENKKGKIDYSDFSDAYEAGYRKAKEE